MVAAQCRLYLQQEAAGRKSAKKVRVRGSSGMPEEAAYELAGWLKCVKCAAVCVCMCVHVCMCAMGVCFTR